MSTRIVLAATDQLIGSNEMFSETNYIEKILNSK